MSEFEDNDIRKYAEPYETSGGLRIWLRRHPDDPRDDDDPRRYWVFVNTQTKMCGHLDEPHHTNPVCVEYWKTQNIVLKTFTNKEMATAFLDGWCEHNNLTIISVSVVDPDEEVDSQDT